jgi:hypothetical protein
VSSPLDEEQLTRKQRREEARAERKALEAAERANAVRRKRLTLIGVPLGALVVAGLVAVIASGGGGGGRSATVTGSGASAGLRTTPAPWAPEYSGLSTRLAALRLPSQSDGAYHVHAALRVYVNGKQVPVPAKIGIEPEATSLASLHTHDASGVIHIESSEPYPFTLGQLFTIWGVEFTATQLGSYVAGAGNVLAVYANGKPVSNPVGYVMSRHDDIVVGYGKSGSFPTSFQHNWASGE